VIAKRWGIAIETLVAGRNAALLNAQIAEFHPKRVVVADAQTAQKINHPHVRHGEEAILEAIEASQSELVINALVGFLGLRPTLKALACKKRIALANKESLVAAGQFIEMSRIMPIDSEHFGLWYLLNDRPIQQMIITASGGAFRDAPIESLEHATLQEVLQHPNWSMGQKITIDSATMVNKMFELIEAHWLFSHRYPEITFDAIIETKSIIHALVDFKDGSSTAHLANADMKLPISFAIDPEHTDCILPATNLREIGTLEFREIDVKRYGVWEIKDDLLKYPERGVIINAANEAGIEKFLQGRGKFTDIARTILQSYERFSTVKIGSLEDTFAIDSEVREYASRI